ncbi:MAG: response regulator transcription factor [Alphaproteobacteria bacterium]|nr:response regulator transcription factor [Alphaproteobacteria bacterium]
MRILVVEDEPGIARLLERGLGEEGHAVTVVATLTDARRAAKDQSTDLYVVDRMLPDGDGLDWVRELRRGGDDRPAILLTARDRVEERVEGLYGGADDYVTKPFAFDELLARIATVTRRAGIAAARVSVGDLEVDTEALRVFRGGAEIALTAQEFRLLRYLAENTGKVLSRTRILEAVWDMRHDPGTNVVDVYISYLRGKIDKGHPSPLIHTVRGLGYVLEARQR